MERLGIAYNTTPEVSSTRTAVPFSGVLDLKSRWAQREVDNHFSLDHSGTDCFQNKTPCGSWHSKEGNSAISVLSHKGLTSFKEGAEQHSRCDIHRLIIKELQWKLFRSSWVSRYHKRTREALVIS